MKITAIEAFPISVPVAQDRQVTLGIGRQVKRDAVVVKVTTEDGIVGWGESHHGRAHLAIGKLISTTLSDLILGMDATDVVGIWAKVYKFQLGSHGMGAACAMAMSGIDTALWDIRGKAVGWPIYKLLGGASRAIPAYVGGICLGYQEPASLVEEVRGFLAEGYKAVKLRVGDSPERDIARVEAVRAAFPDLTILTDANTGYSVRDARQVLSAFAAARVGWLEEPFPAHDHRSYAEARLIAPSVPLAAGENHYTRFEFHRLIEDGNITILQPDISKTGGITETMRIAAMASAWKLPIHCHSSAGICMAATLHVMSAIENAGYFEADCSPNNPLREELVIPAYKIAADGTVRPNDGPGLGIEVDEDLLRRYPGVPGPGYV
ncbi:mandelate racemase/muconate lactonizing enzyme family protein [Roseococcus pinisoli]|uniref:Mandelate racemase/muconate lactonizing enzyme family protein n=1 Tax=Roseococcus pinisoli TaxID=2835040 RepID=A0ABS5QI92_9PROT|nr:mandelate racemase/muconate lactonizing enzyme family protein [Roseococcus pinisoli]